MENISFIDPQQGETVSVVGDTYRIVISGEQTNGRYAVIDMLIPPGGGPGPHAHKDIEEMFYVLDGEVEFKKEGGKFLARSGAFVNIPLGGDVHSFRNESAQVAHLLCTVIPAGLESFFKAIGRPVTKGEFLPAPTPSAEEMEKLKHIAERFGQQLFPPDYLDK